MTRRHSPQGDMFAEWTRYRPGDPWTSKAAAAGIIDKLPKLQKAVYDDFLREAESNGRGLTTYEIEEIHGDHGSTYRTRVSELADLGLVRDTGCTREIKGSRRVIWMLTDSEKYKKE